MEKVLGLNFDDKNSDCKCLFNKSSIVVLHMFIFTEAAPEFDNSDAFKDPNEVGENGQSKSNSDSFTSSQYY